MATHVSIPMPRPHIGVWPGAQLHRARAAFRVWRKTRPFWGGLWTVLGGVLIAYVPITAFRFIMFAGTMLWLGIGVGVLIAVLGVFVWVQPHLRHLLAVVILILSVGSFFTSDFGGFFVGMLLAIIGGSMALAWRVTPEPAVAEAGTEPSPIVYPVPYELPVS